jgi:hypothetical protein
MARAERADDPPFDLRVIDEPRLAGQAAVLLPATFQTWGLTLNRQTSDLIGMKRLLDERYGHSTDDIPHRTSPARRLGLWLHPCRALGTLGDEDDPEGDRHVEEIPGMPLRKAAW